MKPQSEIKSVPSQVTLPEPVALFSAGVERKVLGIEFGAQMNIVRLRRGELWVHSPVPLTESIRRRVDQLGPVKFLIAPNAFHHLFIRDWIDAYPEAESWAHPKLIAKRKDLSFSKRLGMDPPSWSDEIEVTRYRGADMISETAFFHKDSKSLILTDTLLHFRDRNGMMTRLYKKMAGMKNGRPGVSPFIKMLTQDRSAARESIDQLLSLDFSQILMAHGEPVTHDAKETLKKNYEWLK